MTENEIVGYTVTYDQEELQFPVYVVIVLAAILFAGAAIKSSAALFVLGLAPACFAYRNFPLLETGRPRLGAGQYGIFIEGLGLVQWRAIEGIDIVPVVLRGVSHGELHIFLKQPIAQALLLDWRARPMLRRAMRLPWVLGPGNLLRIGLEVFDHTPDDIHRTLARMWRYFRDQ